MVSTKLFPAVSPTAVLSLNVKESKLEPRERGQWRQDREVGWRARTWARVQKDFRCWPLRRRRQHPKSRKEKGPARSTRGEASGSLTTQWNLEAASGPTGELGRGVGQGGDSL